MLEGQEPKQGELCLLVVEEEIRVVEMIEERNIVLITKASEEKRIFEVCVCGGGC